MEFCEKQLLGDTIRSIKTIPAGAYLPHAAVNLHLCKIRILYLIYIQQQEQSLGIDTTPLSPASPTFPRPPHLTMQRTAVIDIVGLTPSLIGSHTPFLTSWLSPPSRLVPISPVLPAVTTAVQSTYVTGKYPCDHGIVANGWYSREDAEVKFWKQSNRLVQADKVWEEARRRDDTNTFTVANSFWWYNMYSSVDVSCTPRPMYPADGRKIPDVYTKPPDLRERLQEQLGQFPLFNFWGPKSNIKSSSWIAKSAEMVEEEYEPTLHFVYLPHLDYCLQKTGTDADEIAEELQEIDGVLEGLVEFLEARGVQVILLSEYGIASVDGAVYINRVLREAGLIQVRVELERELLDAGASKAFAVADHQVAHVYINDKGEYDRVYSLLKELDGVDLVLDADGKKQYHIDHERAGDLVCVAKPNRWFAYYYWLDDDRAPDYARCVDIHRKPGFDPCELFVDPQISFPVLKAAWILAQKEMGFRYLMDLIPLDASLVKGSHGHWTEDPQRGPFLATKKIEALGERKKIEPTEVFDIILHHLNL